MCVALSLLAWGVFLALICHLDTKEIAANRRMDEGADDAR